MVKTCLREAGVKRGEEVVLVEGLDHEQLAMMYCAADVFVAVSHYEEFGLPGLEAMEARTPWVVPNPGFVPEILGHAVRFVEPTAGALADAMNWAISEGPTQADNSRPATVEWSVSARSHREIFGEAAASGAPAVQEL